METGNEDDDLLDCTFIPRRHHFKKTISSLLSSSSSSESSSKSSSSESSSTESSSTSLSLPTSTSSSPPASKSPEDASPFDLGNLVFGLRMFLSNNYEDIANQGTQLAMAGEYERAIEYLSVAISINKNDYRLHFNRSFCYLEINEPKKALEDIAFAVKSNPLWAKGFFKLGQILARLKQFKQAELAYKKALNLGPDCSETRAEIHGNIYDALVDMGFDEIKSGYVASKYFSIKEAQEALIAGVFETNLMLTRNIKKKYLKKQAHKKGILYPVNFF